MTESRIVQAFENITIKKNIVSLLFTKKKIFSKFFQHFIFVLIIKGSLNGRVKNEILDQS